LLETYGSLLRVLEIIEDCTAIKSQDQNSNEDTAYLDPFSMDSLSFNSRYVKSATQTAGNILKATYADIKSVHLEVKKFIENLDEKWVEKYIMDWTEQKLAAEIKASLKSQPKKP
jgi:hypothetical protein